MRHLRACFRRSRAELLQPFAAAGLAATVGCHSVRCSESDAASTGPMGTRIADSSVLLRFRRTLRFKSQSNGRAEFTWQKMRSARSRALVTDYELTCIASLINKLVDLDSWEEEQEQELFEYATAQCLEEIASSLPPPFYDLVRGHGNYLEDSTAEEVCSNLVDQCFHRIQCPFLDEQDRRRIIRAVVRILLESMKEGKDMKTLAEGLEHDQSIQRLIVQVFIEGAMDVFFDDEMRGKLVQDVTSYVPDVPVLPHASIENGCDRVLKLGSGILHDALKEAFVLFLEACEKKEALPILPQPLDDSTDSDECIRIKELWKGRPFLIQLRRVLILKVFEREHEIMGRSRIGKLAKILPERMQALVLGRIVDLTFEHLPGLDRIEATIQPFHADHLHDHAHHSLETDADSALPPSRDERREESVAQTKSVPEQGVAGRLPTHRILFHMQYPLFIGGAAADAFRIAAGKPSQRPEDHEEMVAVPALLGGTRWSRRLHSAATPAEPAVGSSEQVSMVPDPCRASKRTDDVAQHANEVSRIPDHCPANQLGRQAPVAQTVSNLEHRLPRHSQLPGAKPIVDDISSQVTGPQQGHLQRVRALELALMGEARQGALLPRLATLENAVGTTGTIDRGLPRNAKTRIAELEAYLGTHHAPMPKNDGLGSYDKAPWVGA